jgi:threonine synthase
MNFLSHLECGLCGEQYQAGQIWNLCPKCGKPLLVRYHLEKAKKALNRDMLSAREPTLWRYHEMLPVQNKENRLNLGEGFTPMIHASRLGKELGFDSLYIKDEGLNPTGSFKARGLSIAISRAKELGIETVSIPSAGNAGGAMSAYAALAGMKAYVFMPADVPQPFVSECRALGAEVTLIDGLITDCGKAASEGVRQYGRFDVSTLKEPYPDVILYPTGGGTGMVGMWKAFAEMEALGWIGSGRPRMVTVQSEGCAPIVRAFHDGKEFAEPWQGAKTIAEGLRVPAAIGDFLILRALRESNGTAVAVPDSEILEGTNLLGRTQGIFACPEGGAVLVAFKKLRHEGWIHDGETVVLFNTGSGHKYAHLWA